MSDKKLDSIERVVLLRTRKRKKTFNDLERRSCGWIMKRKNCLFCCGFCPRPCRYPRCYSFNFINDCHGRVRRNVAQWGKILGHNSHKEKKSEK